MSQNKLREDAQPIEQTVYEFEFLLVAGGDGGRTKSNVA